MDIILKHRLKNMEIKINNREILGTVLRPLLAFSNLIFTITLQDTLAYYD